MRVNSRTEQEEPNAAKSITDMLAPKRAAPRMENAEPKFTKLMTDRLITDPVIANPMAEQPDPILINWRRLIDDPMFAWCSAETDPLVRTKLLMDSRDPTPTASHTESAALM
jgi:hypothetical protein